MNKILAIAACAVALTGAANAATFNLDFVAAAAGNERGVEGQTLSFGGLGVTLTSSHNAYLDDLSGGKPAGLGVCKVLDGNGQCNPSNDDNITDDEFVTLSFDRKVNLMGFQFYDADHNSLSASNDRLIIDGTKFSFADATAASFNNVMSITFKHNTGGALVDDFYLGSATAMSAVPLPAGMALMLGGLGAFGVASRRKAKAAA